jgi:manganese/zinc/iron transport system permease protein
MMHYFTDPVLRAPTIASMLMCISAALIGVVVFIRKRTLLGEALSHAAYPGVVLSVVVVAGLFPSSGEGLAFGVLIGAFCTALIGLFLIDQLEKRLRVNSDAALCFILASFFGIGVLIASRIQITHALWYKQIQVFLYGQVATMTDGHIAIYGALALLTLLAIGLLYRRIEWIHFDRGFVRSVGASIRSVDNALFLLLVLSIVIGIRSVGVVLMSGMLIAPAVAARQFTHRLSKLFFLAALFGAFSGFFGNYLSLEIPSWLEDSFSLPTGPMILLTAAAICVLALLFAPGRGMVSRLVRIVRFKNQCRLENALKACWKKGREVTLSSKELNASLRLSSWSLQFLIWRMQREGWFRDGKLTEEGYHKASRIVRLHRLWEAYLVYLGQGADKVHHNAEEMEHVITPELEKELTELLQHPKQDPHHQPIPEP